MSFTTGDGHVCDASTSISFKPARMENDNGYLDHCSFGIASNALCVTTECSCVYNTSQFPSPMRDSTHSAQLWRKKSWRDWNDVIRTTSLISLNSAFSGGSSWLCERRMSS